MNFYDLIKNRESIRSYDPNKPVNREILNRILEAGRMAPSAANKQPWQFLLVSSPEMLAKIKKAYAQPWFQEAPHVLVVMGDRQQAWVRQRDDYNSLETDLAIAMDHLILAAEAEGVATCWIANFNPKILSLTLNLKDDEIVFALTPLGFPKPGFTKNQHKQRKPFEQIVKFL